MRKLPFLMALICFSAGTACAREADMPSIGSATMQQDGTIHLQLRAEGPGGAVGDYFKALTPGDTDYRQTIAHVGGLKPGESKPVPPYEKSDSRQDPQ